MKIRPPRLAGLPDDGTIHLRLAPLWLRLARTPGFCWSMWGFHRGTPFLRRCRIVARFTLLLWRKVRR